MKYQKGLIAALSLSLIACGQTNLTANQSNIQPSERAARIEALIPARVQGQARQALTSFLQSYPGDLQKVTQVILVEDSALLNQQGLGAGQVKIYSNLSKAEEQQIKPFHQTRTIKSSDVDTVQPLNLALCQSSGSGGYFSQKTATNYYGGLRLI